MLLRSFRGACWCSSECEYLKSGQLSRCKWVQLGHYSYPSYCESPCDLAQLGFTDEELEKPTFRAEKKQWQLNTESELKAEPDDMILQTLEDRVYPCIWSM